MSIAVLVRPLIPLDPGDRDGPPVDRSRLGDKLIIIVQVEIDLLRVHRLGDGAVWH